MIAIASDHAAVEFKKIITEHLENKGFEVLDFGSFDNTPADYPDFAYSACRAVLDKRCGLAVLICGTGIGMSMAANKMKGIRCAVCGDVFSAKATRLHNDANVLALGERVIGPGLALEIVDAFVSTKFSGEERHVRRVGKITKIESGEGL